jgi:hypothetical protein
VIAVKGLPIWRWPLWIECSRIRNDLAADRKAALLLDHQRFELALVSLLSRRHGEGQDCHQEARDKSVPTVPVHPYPSGASSARMSSVSSSVLHALSSAVFHFTLL